MPGIAAAGSPGYGTVNLALGQPVTALTGTVMGSVSGVNDGSNYGATSYWYSVSSTNCVTIALTCNPPNVWGNGVYFYDAFTLDLGSVRSIGKVNISPLQTRGMRISSSTDGVNWTEQHKVDGYDTTGLANALIGPLTFTPNGAYSARYFKYEGWAWWYQYVGVTEFQVYEWLPDTPNPPDLSGLTNLALGKPAATYGGTPVAGHDPSLLTDGASATYWQQNNASNLCYTAEWSGLCPDGVWFTDLGSASIDLGAPKTIQAIRMTFPAGGPGAQSYTINLSDSATNATPAIWWAFGGDPAVMASLPAVGSTATRVFYLPAPVTARYLFLTVGNHTTNGPVLPAVGEVEVFGTLSGPTTYTLTASAGPNGSISPSGAITVNSGASQTFAIAASAGYHIADVLVDGLSIGPVPTYTFGAVTANHTIAASFVVDTFTITASAGPNGTITPAGAVSVTFGASQAFTLAPATGYYIADVTVDGASVGAVTSYTFASVGANHTIVASFAVYTFTITASAGPNGTISPAGAVSVNYGASQTFTAVPAPGYQVSSLVVDGVAAGTLASYTFSGVTANHSIAVTFATIPGCPSLKLLRLHVVAFGPDMKNNGLLNSLLARLDAAQASVDRGNFNSFQGQIGAFINELQAQSGKGLPAKAADMLIAEATALLTSCR